MNEKLELLGLLFLGDNIILTDPIILMIEKRNAGLKISLSSIIDCLKTKLKFKRLNNENT